MNKIFLFVSLAFSAFNPLYAQMPKVTLSKPFDEPESGATRLLLLKDGSTLYFHFTVKNGIEVTCFNEKHQKKATTTLSGKIWEDRDMKSSELKGIYEINGEAVIFLQQVIKHKPFLFRIIVNPKTGKLVNEALVGELPKYGPLAGYAVVFGGVKELDFYVEKDPESDYYAIAQFNTFASNKDERIHIVHYSPDHKEINSAFYESPKGAYKYLDYQGMYVHGDEFVFIATYAYNTRRSGGKDSRIIISQLLKNTTKFKHNVLKYTAGFSRVSTGLQYDAANKSLRMLNITSMAGLQTPARVKHRNSKFVMWLSFIDPVKLEVMHNNVLEESYVNEYAQQKLHFKNDYTGMPQDFIINPDGTATIMMEELNQVEHMSRSGSYFTTEMDNIGIAKINALGEEIGGYAVAKSQETNGYHGYFQSYQRDRGAWNFRVRGLIGANGNMAPFFSFEYLNTSHAEYVIFNDYEVNIRNQDESYRNKKEMHFVSETSTVCFRRLDNKMEKFFLYGDPGNKKVHRYSILEATTHSRDQKEMVTIMLEKQDGHDAEAHIAWIDFE